MNRNIVASAILQALRHNQLVLLHDNGDKSTYNDVIESLRKRTITGGQVRSYNITEFIRLDDRQTEDYCDAYYQSPFIFPHGDDNALLQFISYAENSRDIMPIVAIDMSAYNEITASFTSLNSVRRSVEHAFTVPGQLMTWKGFAPEKQLSLPDRLKFLFIISKSDVTDYTLQNNDAFIHLAIDDTANITLPTLPGSRNTKCQLCGNPPDIFISPTDIRPGYPIRRWISICDKCANNMKEIIKPDILDILKLNKSREKETT